MNNKRRTQLMKATVILEQAKEIVSDVYMEEVDCLNNIPENLENTERYSKIEDASDNLDSAMESIGEAIDYINEASS